jgi:hypothetical protein
MQRVKRWLASLFRHRHAWQARGWFDDRQVRVFYCARCNAVWLQRKAKVR